MQKLNDLVVENNALQCENKTLESKLNEANELIDELIEELDIAFSTRPYGNKDEEIEKHKQIAKKIKGVKLC